MKFICIISLVTLLAVLVYTFSENNVDLVEQKYDYGIIYPGQKLEHSFIIRNNHRRGVKLGQVKTSCGCTSLRIEKDYLAPGETTSISTIVIPKPYDERIREEAVLVGEDGSRRTIYKFVVSAIAYKVIDFSDEFTEFRFKDYYEKDLPQKMDVEIKRGPHPLKWDTLRCSSDNDYITPVVNRTKDDTWKLCIILNKNEYCGGVRGKLKFSFFYKGEEQPYHLYKHVDARIIGPIEPIPKSLLLGTLYRGDETKGIIHFKNSCTKPYQILSAESTSPDEVKTAIVKKGSDQDIEFTFLATKVGTRYGTIVVNVACEKLYKIKINFLSKVLPKRPSGDIVNFGG